jgi:hypothetical protein
MLAPNPSQHLESQFDAVRNLEGSVRSRDNQIAAGTERDLIEAGLN